MLERIPSKIFQQSLNAHFDSINSKLSAYEAKLSAYEGSMMLELAIWKSKIAEQTDGNINLLIPDMRMGCCNDSLWMAYVAMATNWQMGYFLSLPFLTLNTTKPQ